VFQLPVDPQTLVGFCLVLARAGAWVAICPPFNMPSMPVRVRVGVAVALSFALAGSMGEQAALETLSTAALIAALFTQILAGFALGMFVAVIFAAVQSAGELIDLQVGFSMGAVVDPLSGNNSTPIGRMHQLLGLAILFAINGHLLVVGAFVRSVEVAPLGRLDWETLGTTLAELISVLFAASIEIALPVLTALFLTEVALGFLGKAAPQLNIMVLGFAAKSFLALTLLGATLVLLPEAVESLVGRGIRAAFGVLATVVVHVQT
jgi:flagellar biosynthetic protein FliR